MSFLTPTGLVLAFPYAAMWRHGRAEMTVGEILAVVAVVIIVVELWIARQARIVCEEVEARRIAMEAEDQAEEERMRRDSAKWRRLRARGR